jgi:hypothetical protein
MKYKIFIGIVALEVTVLVLLFIAISLSARNMQPALMARQQLVSCFMLTDLSLWTETRYTRHPSQSDLFTPFQDFPGAIEHFPAGSIVFPPMLSGFAPPGDKDTEPTLN